MWKSKFYGAFVLNHRVVLHAIDARISTQAHGTSNPFISKINGVPCGWGQCALDAALRLIAEADRNADGLLTRSELAAYDGPVPASCDVGRDWSASAKARGGDWDERTQRKTGLARLCYQVLCDRGRSIALGQAYRSGYRKARPEADCARRSVAVVLSGGFTSPAHKYGDDGAGSRRGSASDLMSDASRRLDAGNGFVRAGVENKPSPTSGPCSPSSRARS